MTSLCRLLSQHISQYFTDNEMKDWRIYEYGELECRIEAPDILISFYRDSRDSQIEFTITNTNSCSSASEPLFGYIIYKAFDDFIWDERKSLDGSDEMARSLRNFRGIFNHIHNNSSVLSGLAYFQSGYNCAYTEYASGLW